MSRTMTEKDQRHIRLKKKIAISALSPADELSAVS